MRSGKTLRQILFAMCVLGCLAGTVQAYTTEFASRVYEPMPREFDPVRNQELPVTVRSADVWVTDFDDPRKEGDTERLYVEKGDLYEYDWYSEDPEKPCPFLGSLAFDTWFYQNVLTVDGFSKVAKMPMEEAPMRLRDWETEGKVSDDPTEAKPYLPSYYAKFTAIEGLDSLKYIPWAGTDGGDPPVASARYRVVVGGQSDYNYFGIAPSDPYGLHPINDVLVDPHYPEMENRPNIHTGAVFFITAVYDETMFDVSMAAWRLKMTSPSPPVAYNPGNYQKAYPLRSGVSAPFVPQGYIAPPRFWYADPAKPGGAVFNVPEYVTVRLRPGRRLEELGGRTVRLMLHTTNWSGYKGRNDILSFACTSQVLVGADPSTQVNDWRIEPPALQDECVPPSFDKRDTKAAEADTVGTRVVNSLNVDRPALRAGHARLQVGPTLSETLANEACWEAFVVRFSGQLPALYAHELVKPSQYDATYSPVDASFLRVNINGRWFAVEDIPGLRWYWEPNTPEADKDDLEQLVVHDTRTNMYYRYLAPPTDYASWPRERWGLDAGRWNVLPPHYNYAFRKAKLRYVDDNEEQGNPVLEYAYSAYDSENGAPTGELEDQIDCRHGHHIQYDLQDKGDTAELKATAYAQGSSDTRVVTATFGADTGAKPRPVLSASGGSGGTWRQYEWYPYCDPPTPKDGKLKKVIDGASNVLTRLDYDDKGRLTCHSRGSDDSRKVIAEYEYKDPPLGSPGSPPADAGVAIADTTMEARFYVDDVKYELIKYTFSPEGQMLQIDQYQKLQPAEGEGNATSRTTFEYRDSAAGQYVIKTLPGGQSAEYTEYGAGKGFNVLNHFLAPPVSAFDPASVDVDSCVNWMQYDYDNFNNNGATADRWRKTKEINKSNGDSTTTHQYEGASGYLTTRIDPTFTTLNPSGSGVVTLNNVYVPTYHPGYHAFIDWETNVGPHGEELKTTYTPNEYWDVTRRTDSCGGISRVWDYGVNAFGERYNEVDPDGYVSWKDFQGGSGLLAGTCVYEDYVTGTGRGVQTAPVGNVVKQTTYDYTNGYLWKIRVADNPGAFAKDSPANWITTEYGYDEFGRLTSKVVTGYGTTSYEYDYQDRLKKVTFPDGRSKTIIRNSGLGQITRIEYRGTDGQVLASDYQYDPAGNLIDRKTQSCPQCGHHTTYQYDMYNRRTVEIREEAR